MGNRTLQEENYPRVGAGAESAGYPLSGAALPQTSSSTLGKWLYRHNLDVNGCETHERFSICSLRSRGNGQAPPRRGGVRKIQ